MAVHYETESPPAPRPDLGPYRARDYFALPDEPRCELLYGRLVVTPSPTFRHQDLVAELLLRLRSLARTQGWRVVASPLDVTLADHSVVQPDLLLISPQRAAIIGERVEGAPDLVVEVLSPSTARRDLGEKMKLYAESGILEYWLIDPAARTFEFLVNRDGSWLVRLPREGVYRSDVVAGLELELEALWAALPA